MPELLAERAASHPDGVAFVVDGRDELTFAVWDRRSSAVGRGLARRGVRRGDRVVLLFDNFRWVDAAVAYVGVHRAGGVAVPLTPRFGPAELAQVLAQCQPTARVCPPDLAPQREDEWLALEELEQGGEPSAVEAELAPDDLAEILYTSGTTGLPKGIACSHRSVLFDVGEQRVRFPDATFVHAFPLGTNAGQEALRLPLRTGNLVVVLPVFDPHRLRAVVAAHRGGPLHLLLVPAMAHLLLDAGDVHDRHLDAVTHVTLSTSPAPPALLARLAAALPGARISNAYALSEGGAARTVMHYDAGRPGSVGRPVGDTEVRIVDEAGRDRPPGQEGEVWLRRPGAPRREYYRDPAATARAFAGEWLRTGDVGYLDDDGYLYLVDRRKDIIISGGHNVSSVEVENVLYEHPAVVEAAVVGVPHPVLGEAVAAALVTRSPVDARELQGFVRRRLAEHKVPHRVVLLERLPRNASGKVLKRELRERLAAHDAPLAAPTATATATEELVASIWESVLGVTGIAPSDDFFDRGGHSLAATQILARLEDACGIRLPETALFDWPTVAELAAAVDARAAAPRS